MSEATSGTMSRHSFIAPVLLLLLLASCSSADPAKKSITDTPTGPVPVAERKADTIKAQASDSGYGPAPSHEYSQQQQQQQEYQPPPPPPPPPAQAYGQQVQVTEQDYSRPNDQQQQQQPYDAPLHPQAQQPAPAQNYGVKGQPSRPQASYSSLSYPAAPAAQHQQQQQHQQQSYNQQSAYPASNYGAQENSYNSQSAAPAQSSYQGNSGGYQAPASSYPNSQSQSYGTPLESTYESPADYANDPEDDGAYENADTGYGTSAPEHQTQHPQNNNYQSAGPKAQGYQVAAPHPQQASYPPPPPPPSQPQAPRHPAPQYPPHDPQPPPQAYAPAPSSSYHPAPPQHQQAAPDTGYGNGAAAQEAGPSKGGYSAAPSPSGSGYASPDAQTGISYPGSDSRGQAPYSAPAYPETSYSYGQQQQQQQAGSNYNIPLNYGGFRPIQLVAPQSGSSYPHKEGNKPLVVAIIQKDPLKSPYAGQQQGDHYAGQLQSGGGNGGSGAYGAQQDNIQYQPQQIPANAYSGPTLPLTAYASPNSYQSSGPTSYAPHPQPAGQSTPAYSSQTGSGAQHPGQQAGYQQPINQYTPEQLHAAGYELATEQESSEDEYSSVSGHGAAYGPGNYNPAGPGYPEYPKAPLAQPYSNAGFALDYAEGKPYGGRWLQKPYAKRFVKAKKQSYAGNADAYDVHLPLKYGPPPPPEEAKPAAPAPAPYLASYASMPQVSVYPEEASAAVYGAPHALRPLAATYPAKLYRNPSLTQSVGSYGVQNHNLRIPSSYGTLTSEESELYLASLAGHARPAKPKKQRAPVAVADSDLASGLADDDSGYKLIPSASRLIPNIVKSPLKKIMKAFSKNKLLSWKRKEAKEVTTTKD